MMNQISELDLQNLRHLIGGYDTSHAKMTEYASRAADPEVRQFFQKSAQSAMQSRQQLMQFPVKRTCRLMAAQPYMKVSCYAPLALPQLPPHS